MAIVDKNTDRIAAAIALVGATLGAVLPERLGLSAQAVTVLGGILVALAGIVRLAYLRGATGKFDWRDALGGIVGVVAIGLGLDGELVAEADPNVIASASSVAALVAAGLRGWGKPSPAAAVLLLVFFCGGCSGEPVVDATCTELAARSSNFEAAHAACRAELEAGRSVCVLRSYRMFEPYQCALVVPAPQPG